MQPPAPREENRSQPPEIVERLFVFTIVSVVLILVAAIAVVLVLRGHLQKQSNTISQQTTEIEELSRRLEQTEQSLASLRSAAPRRNEPAARPSPPQPASRPTTQPPPASAPASAESFESSVQRLLLPGEDWPLELADPAGAQAELDRLRSVPAAPALSAQAWARWAVAALWLGHEDLAATYASRAEAGGRYAHEWADIRARKLLAAGDARGAAMIAQDVFQATRGAPAARLTLCETALAVGEPAAAERALGDDAWAESLPAAAKLRAAAVFVALDDFGRLGRLLDAVTTTPAAHQAQFNRYRAIAAAVGGKPVEALAIFDHLLESTPDDYDLRIWRGVALLHARQFDAARAQLEQADPAAPGPRAWYWRGRLELDAGAPQAAIEYFDKALTADAQHVPCLEARASIELAAADAASNRGDWDAVGTRLKAADELLRRAVAVRPRRASAHFMRAIAAAKAGDGEIAAESLRAALRADPALLASALQAEVLTRVIPAVQIERLARGEEFAPASAPSASSAAAPSSTPP